jgi:hypothetical protein
MTLRLQNLSLLASAIFAGIAIYEIINHDYEVAIAVFTLAIWIAVWAKAWRPRR